VRIFFWKIVLARRKVAEKSVSKTFKTAMRVGVMGVDSVAGVLGLVSFFV
jgi:hypothetical protein